MGWLQYIYMHARNDTLSLEEEMHVVRASVGGRDDWRLYLFLLSLSLSLSLSRDSLSLSLSLMLSTNLQYFL